MSLPGKPLVLIFMFVQLNALLKCTCPAPNLTNLSTLGRGVAYLKRYQLSLFHEAERSVTNLLFTNFLKKKYKQ